MQPMLLYPRRSRFAPTKRLFVVKDEKEHISDKKSKQLWSVCQGFFPNIVRPYYIKSEFWQVCLFFLYLIECYCYKLSKSLHVLYNVGRRTQKKRITNIIKLLSFELHLFRAKGDTGNY